MVQSGAVGQYAVAIVSCDIVEHSSAELPDQIARVVAINEIVSDVIGSSPAGDVVWASGGDGGHIIFRQELWQQPAIDLILRLRRWSESAEAPLRITGHYGIVTHIRGADGRVQLVGDGINYAGWLLSQASREGIVISDPFRQQSELADKNLPVSFHDPRTIASSDFQDQLLFLMSTDGFRSMWINSGIGDRSALKQAADWGDGWDIAYFTKRIWQVHSADKYAARALESIRPSHLRYHDNRSSIEEINPFFAFLQPDQLKEVIRLGNLVERRRGDLVCRYDDPGDSMFVILRGTVGVYNSEGSGFDGAAEPLYIQRRGEIVGELAYALSRNRTADLVALDDVALLSFNNEELQSRLASTQVGEAATAQVSAFINYRVLQHVSDNAPYLLGPRRTGPLSAGPGSWADALADLRKHAELIDVDTRALEVTLANLPISKRTGIYILAAGGVAASDAPDVPLKGADFPLLWADLPNLGPLENPRIYQVQDEPIKVLRIAAEGIDKELHARQREALRKALARTFQSRSSKQQYDVFLSYSREDWNTVSEIHQRLTEAGITCWLDEARMSPASMVIEDLNQGLSNSRSLIACFSNNFVQSSWAQRELNAALHLDVARHDGRSVLLLMLNEDDDEVVPPLLADAKRVYYTREREFDHLVDYLSNLKD